MTRTALGASGLLTLALVWLAPLGAADLPRDRLEAALELLAEMVLHPTFPEREVERLRDERQEEGVVAFEGREHVAVVTVATPRDEPVAFPQQLGNEQATAIAGSTGDQDRLKASHQGLSVFSRASVIAKSAGLLTTLCRPAWKLVS